MSSNQPEPSAVLQVLFLPELLELILLNLKSRDLLLAQRVNRTFRDTITQRCSLQRALFFLPDWNRGCRSLSASASASTSKATSSARKPENNRMLMRAFPQNYPTVTLRMVEAEPYSGPAASTHDAVHELAAITSIEWTGCRWRWDIDIAFPTSTPHVSDEQPVWRPEASWRRMYLSQPPCTALHLVKRWRRSTRPVIELSEDDQSGNHAEGVTMGQLVDAVLQGPATTDPWPKWWVGSDGDWHFDGQLGMAIT